MPCNPGQGAERLAATTSDASPPRDGSVPLIVADLEGHDLSGLRRRWRDHLGGEPPRPSPTLAADEGAGLSAPVGRLWRSR
jgi:hypothetical protein